MKASDSVMVFIDISAKGREDIEACRELLSIQNTNGREI